ncbi:amino acid aminotransferase [Chelatococcus sp. SYSU_G07232]|uniref:Aminotransferase n=1 Tax=Chelatococcus albus TaxID=3047466 RepID=A0ABT7ACA5_9HYPH|nr:amino acid aminotransferase [Chelatococcus sp. SYSU_G07232]MDJ1157007.1 amino acid aminotransferase [Chelatococcus sp. SYSU_G07232]
MFKSLSPLPPDPLLALIDLHRADPRPRKVDLGVGVYRDERGETPVMQAVKKAEQRLWQEQRTKSYLGPGGDLAFFARLRDLVLGADHPAVVAGRVAGVQTPGGTGALRLAADLVRRSASDARIFVGTPSWPNHVPIMATAGIDCRTHPYFDVAMQSVLVDVMVAALGEGRANDAVLLHGCCHNPAGADLDAQGWARVEKALSARGLVPVIDLAYHGLGDGLEQDLAPARGIAARLPRAILCVSCSKNFALYRDRVGAILVVTESAEEARVVQSVLESAARVLWSMPPDHGAAAARLVLEDEELRAEWRAELDTMRARIAGLRQALAAAGRAAGLKLDAIARQKGMFSTLPLTPAAVEGLRRDHAIYAAPSGRINVAGLTLEDVAPVVEALGRCAGETLRG